MDGRGGPDEATPRTTMTIELNHTIVYVQDKRASAEFLTELFELPEPVAWGSFLTVELGNG